MERFDQFLTLKIGFENQNFELFKEVDYNFGKSDQSYEIKSPPWTILWFRILGIFSVENIKRLCVLMFQT